MKESEYVLSVNRIKISIAMEILESVLVGKDCVINKKKINKIIKELCEMQLHLFSLTKIDIGE